MAGYVFISYARSDASYVRLLADYLRGKRIPVWYDVELPTVERWREGLAQKIADCSAFILVASPASDRCRWVEYETQYAISQGRELFSVVVGGTPRFGIDHRKVDVGLPGNDFIAELRRLIQRPPLPAGSAMDRTLDWAQPPPPPVDEMQRPELAAALAALRRSFTAAPRRLVITGQPGSGKSTLASLLAARPEVRRAFPGGIIWFGLGDSRRGLGLRSAMARLYSALGGWLRRRESLSRLLSRLLSEQPPTLLILDDVRSSAQLAPFVESDLGETVLLVTTRDTASVLEGSHVIRLAALNDVQRRRLLLTGLDELSETVVDALLEVSGQWPLSLWTLNRALHLALRQGRQPAVFVKELVRHPAIRGRDTPHPYPLLEAIVELTADDGNTAAAQRLLELGVFAEHSTVDRDLVIAFWSETGGLQAPEADALLDGLAALGLIWQREYGGRSVIQVADEVRELLAARLGRSRGVHRRLLAAFATCYRLEPGRAPERWRQLPTSATYARNHLVHHLLAAGLADEARRLCLDLRWLSDQLRTCGIAAVSADLAAIADPRAAALSRVLNSSADSWERLPAHSYADMLVSRLAEEKEFLEELADLEKSLPAGFVRMRARWSWPGRGDDPLRRVFAAHPSGVQSVGVVGHWIASAGLDHTVHIWDAATGAAISALDGHRGAVLAVAWSPDASRLWTGSRDSTVRVWNWQSGECEATIPAHRGWVNTVAVSADYSVVATGGNDGAVRLWDARTMAPRATLAGHEHAVRTLAFAPSGRMLASAGDDGVVRLWDLTTGALSRVLAGHPAPVRAVGFAADGDVVFSAGDDAAVRLWDVATGELVALMTGHSGPVNAATAGRSWIASASNDEVIVWSITGEARGVLRGRAGTVRTMGVVLERDWLVTAGDDGQLRVWDVEAFTRETDPFDALNAVVVAPGGGWLATAGEDGNVYVRRTSDGAAVRVLEGHQGAVGALAFAPDQTWLASASDDRTVRLWDMASGTVRSVLTGHRGWIGGLAVAPDGSWLATAGDDRTVRIWDTATATEQAVLTGHTDRVNGVAISPDGKWLISTSDDRTIRVWDAITGSARAVLSTNADWVRAVAVSPDGTWFATASGDGNVRIWDAEELVELSVLSGHDGPVSWVSIAPDGAYVATTGGDGTVRIWNPVTGVNVAAVRVDGPLLGVDWAADGSAVYAVGQGGAFRFDLLGTGHDSPDVSLDRPGIAGAPTAHAAPRWANAVRQSISRAFGRRMYGARVPRVRARRPAPRSSAWLDKDGPEQVP